MTELRELLDKQAIAEVLYLYCRACDRADEVLLRSCFHAGSTHRHGGFEGRSADFVSFAMKIIDRSQTTKHVLSNVLIELDGDNAIAESHYSAYHRVLDRKTGAAEDQFSGGRYIDRFEKRDGSWRIAARVGLIDYERILPASERGIAALPVDARSQRLGADALYDILGLDGSRKLP